MKYLSDEKLLKTMRIFYWAAQYRIKCSNAFETVKKNVKKKTIQIISKTILNGLSSDTLF